MLVVLTTSAEGPGVAATLLFEMPLSAQRPLGHISQPFHCAPTGGAEQGPGHAPRGGLPGMGPRVGQGHLPSSSVLSCSSTSVQSMREITPFCRGGSRGSADPPGGLGAAPAPAPHPASQPTAPGTGRCCHGCTHSPWPAQRLLSPGKKQLLTAGISRFSLYNRSTNLFINYLI